MIICAALGLQLPALRSVDRRALRDAAVPVLAAGVLALAPLSSFAADPKDVDPIGKSIFEYNCAACHRGGQNIIMPEKTLEKDVRRATQFCAHGAYTIANAAHSV